MDARAWVESLHPRDEKGRFGEGDGGGEETVSKNVSLAAQYGITSDRESPQALREAMERLDELLPGTKIDELQSALGGKNANGRIDFITSTSSKFSEDKVEVTGTLHDPKTGLEIGQFHRTFLKQGPPGREEVAAHHDSLFLTNATQGHGIGQSVLKETLKFEKEHGVSSVELDTADVGKYVWASNGFGWSQSTGEHMQDGFESYLQMSPKLPDGTYGKGLSAEAAHKIASEHGSKPWELAAVKVKMPGGGEASGKEFLLKKAPSYHAVLKLKDGDPGWEHARKKLGL